MPVFRNQKPLAILELLTRRSDRLSRLCSRATELAHLRRVLERGLPSPLQDHVMVAGFDDKILILQADAPAWAARLRFQLPQLLALAREKCGLKALQTIRIQVAVPFQSPRRPDKRLMRLSSRAVECLRSSAASTTDFALRECLLRLSRHH